MAYDALKRQSEALTVLEETMKLMDVGHVAVTGHEGISLVGIRVESVFHISSYGQCIMTTQYSALPLLHVSRDGHGALHTAYVPSS